MKRSSHSTTWILSGLLLFTACAAVKADVKPAKLIGDNMVLQREGSAPVWGTADPGETITVTLGDQKTTATADANGNWKAVFQGLKPNNGETMTIAGKSNTITVKNVAVGDVWICSGQSNMDYRLLDKDEIASANNPDLRYFNVANYAAAERQSDVRDGGPWVSASPSTAGTFSAVGYYFGKNIHAEIGVPIGLIGCAWSGSPIEPFVTQKSLDTVPGLAAKWDPLVAKLKTVIPDGEKAVADYKAWTEKYGRADTESKGFAAGWANPSLDTKDWITTDTPNDWSKTGVPKVGIAPHGGVVWVRKTFQCPDSAVGKDFTLNPGPISESATLYFNGEQIATGDLGTSPYYWNEARPFKIPGRLVKAGDNVVVFRIISQKQYNHAFDQRFHLNIPVVDPTAVTHDWLAKAETEYAALPQTTMAELPQAPSVKVGGLVQSTFNGTIAPLTSYGIKGVLWYQGETNAFMNPGAYYALLPQLIAGWRDEWNIGNFPFYIVQLANFGAPPTAPGQGSFGWAMVREDQLKTSQTVPNTGMATIVDIGEANNIHPLDKKDVGYRLSLQALANTYGKKIEPSGPIYDSMTVEGNKIRIKFTHLGGGLDARGGPLKQFVICGTDHKWAAGASTIDGDTILVSSPDVATPVAVRYAWADNPEGCNLYSKLGLPASPFRTDDFPTGFENKW